MTSPPNAQMSGQASAKESAKQEDVTASNSNINAVDDGPVESNSNVNNNHHNDSDDDEDEKVRRIRQA